MMKYGGLTLVMLAAAGLALIVSCGDDNPVGPGTPKDYPVYFYDGANYGWFFEYFPASNTIDSFNLSFQPSYKFRVSADGKYLYVGLDYTLAIVDLESRQVIKELPYTGAAIVSPDNHLLAIVGPGLYILRTSDYSVVYQDTINTQYGSFSRDSKQLYCAYYDNATESSSVVIVDVWRQRAKSYPVPSGAFLTNVIPSDDESRWFLWYELGSCASDFVVYDPREDSILFNKYLTPGKGQMLMAPNGKKVFYTNPGPWLDIGCCRPPSEIYAYNVRSNSGRAISTLGLVSAPYDKWLPMGELAILPDGDRLATAQDGGWPVILCLNMRRMAFEKYYEMNGSHQIMNLTCQTGK